MAIRRLKNFFSNYRFSFRSKYFQPFTQSEKRALLASLIVLGVLVIIFATTYILSVKRPKISYIEPSLASPSDEIKIVGKYLKNSSIDQIYFAGKFLTMNNIISWEEDQIIIKVPDPCRSGFVFVKTNLGRSNGKLFTNSLHIPKGVSEDKIEVGPVILSTMPISGNPGDLVLLKGKRFGKFQKDSTICISDDSRSAISIEEIDPLSIELWSDEQIRFRLPPIDFKGTLFVKSFEQQSMPIDIEINIRGAKKEIRDFLLVNIEQSCTFTPKGLSKEKINGHLDFPVPISLPHQYNQIVKAQEDIKFFNSASSPLYSRYHVKLKAKKILPITVSRTFSVKTKAISYSFDEQAINPEYDNSSLLYQYYTALGSLNGDTSKTISDLATRISRGQKTPLARARALYQFIIDNLKDDLEFNGNIDEALTAKIGNAYHYSGIFVATCKQLKIPARLVEGWYKTNEGFNPHCWSEFYLNGVGWVPVDCYLADINNYENGKLAEDIDKTLISENGFEPYSYYFGNLPYNRVVFSCGKESWSTKYNLAVSQIDVKESDKMAKPLYISRNKAFADCMGYFSSSTQNYMVYLTAMEIE